MSQEQDVLHLQKIIEGDTESFSYFIEKYQDMVHGIAMSIAIDPVEARTLTQDTFVRLYKNLQSYRGDAQFSTWLYRIAINEGLAHVRKQQRNKIVLMEHIPQDQSTLSFNDGEASLDRKELHIKISQILSQLKPKERLILELYYLQEFTLNELIEITGFSKSYTKVLLHRGRKHFESLYSKTNGHV